MTEPETPKQEHAHLWFLLDRSGSMAAIHHAVVEGLAEFMHEQHAGDPAALFTLVQFDDESPHEIVIDAKPLADVAPLTHEGYQPRGATPLYDAIGKLIERADAHVAAGGVDGDQMVIVFTDGYENASRHFTRTQVFQAIGEHRDRGWTFAFLGANQDAYETGGSMGLTPGASANWDATDSGTRRALRRASGATRDKIAGSRAQRIQTREQYFEQGDDPKRSG